MTAVLPVLSDITRAKRPRHQIDVTFHTNKRRQQVPRQSPCTFSASLISSYHPGEENRLRFRHAGQDGEPCHPSITSANATSSAAIPAKLTSSSAEKEQPTSTPASVSANCQLGLPVGSRVAGRECGVLQDRIQIMQLRHVRSSSNAPAPTCLQESMDSTTAQDPPSLDHICCFEGSQEKLAGSVPEIGPFLPPPSGAFKCSDASSLPQHFVPAGLARSVTCLTSPSPNHAEQISSSDASRKPALTCEQCLELAPTLVSPGTDDTDDSSQSVYQSVSMVSSAAEETEVYVVDEQDVVNPAVSGQERAVDLSTGCCSELGGPYAQVTMPWWFKVAPQPVIS
jgi:hypothetical protein